MKQSDGFSRPIPTVVTILDILTSFGLLAWSKRTLALGTAYTIWTGFRAVGAFLFGVIALSEPLKAMRLTAAALIVSGLVMMKLAAPV